MPTIKRFKRRASANRSQSFVNQFRALQRGIREVIQQNQRQQRLRRQRQQRQGGNSQARQELMALRRALQFRWLQRWQQRRQRNQQSNRNPMAWFWPRAGETLSTREAASLLLRLAAAGLLLLVLISAIPNAIPIQLLSPNWYLQLLAYVGDNVPVLILSAVFGLLSLVFGSDNEATSTYRNRLLRLSRIGYVLALLLIPLQLGCTAWLFGQTYSTIRTQRTAIRANAQALISGANQAASIEQFVAYLRSRNITANLESIAAAPLIQVRSEFTRSVKANQQQQEQNLDTSRSNTILNFSLNSAKVLIALITLATFMRGLQTLARRCSPMRADDERILQNAGHSPAPNNERPQD